jgi:hypothetical protein
MFGPMMLGRIGVPRIAVIPFVTDGADIINTIFPGFIRPLAMIFNGAGGFPLPGINSLAYVDRYEPVAGSSEPEVRNQEQGCPP